MSLATVFNNSKRRKSNFNFEKANGTKNKFDINTLTPKFQYKNSKGEMVTFIKRVQL
ncbi:MAG: hypothetical protein HKP59_02365 [Lutibacter sp.]|uniref:hypothetical protein n=1 Tax=Lutibacter sp. TaxID=1925666 RepID=UPI0017BF30EB|nr:hypothetical protein [Lutibacter sp.]MBT8316448.1 hypothetical protein [Lutibacter sp.]NNJ57308.1 hypothetical protein [Lutibacter sp.]